MRKANIYANIGAIVDQISDTFVKFIQKSHKKTEIKMKLKLIEIQTNAKSKKMIYSNIQIAHEFNLNEFDTKFHGPMNLN